MNQDRLRLPKFAVVSVIMIAMWLGLSSLSHNVILQVVLGWTGFAVVAFYYRWLRRQTRKTSQDDRA